MCCLPYLRDFVYLHQLNIQHSYSALINKYFPILYVPSIIIWIICRKFSSILSFYFIFLHSTPPCCHLIEKWLLYWLIYPGADYKLWKDIILLLRTLWYESIVWIQFIYAFQNYLVFNRLSITAQIVHIIFEKENNICIIARRSLRGFY